MSEIEERKKELSLAVRKLRDSEQQLCNLQAKKSELLSRGTAGITDAKNHRQQTLTAFVTGRASQVELDGATSALEELEKGAKLSAEMAEAITGAIQAAEKNIAQLKTAIDIAKRGLYESVYGKLKQEIQEIISARVSKVVVVLSRPEPEYDAANQATMNDIFSEIAGALEKEFKLNQR